jgi:hypothetical protein
MCIRVFQNIGDPKYSAVKEMLLGDLPKVPDNEEIKRP